MMMMMAVVQSQSQPQQHSQQYHQHVCMQDRKRPRGDGNYRDRQRDPMRDPMREPGSIDRTYTPPFLIRAFPYVVALQDIEGPARDPAEESDGNEANRARPRKPVGAAGLTKAYRPPDSYKFVFNPEEPVPDMEEIRVYTYADATLKSVLDEIKREMGKRGMLRDETSGGPPGISIAAAWEEWHRNEERFFMRCRSVGKVGMDESWVKSAEGMGIDPRGFPDKSDSTLRDLKWNVGDAMDICFMYAS